MIIHFQFYSLLVGELGPGLPGKKIKINNLTHRPLCDQEIFSTIGLKLTQQAVPLLSNLKMMITWELLTQS